LQVIIYDRLLGVRRTIGRFKDKAYGGTFRSDGKLLAAGGEDGIVQVSFKSLCLSSTAAFMKEVF
jgi:U3 small nucleolar RNA-associated protein 15